MPYFLVVLGIQISIKGIKARSVGYTRAITNTTSLVSFGWQPLQISSSPLVTSIISKGLIENGKQHFQAYLTVTITPNTRLINKFEQKLNSLEMLPRPRKQPHNRLEGNINQVEDREIDFLD